MYDRAKRVGRHGFEIQTVLLVHPSCLNFDPHSKKLGTKLDATALGNLSAPPPHWEWTADPSFKTAYMKADEAPRADRLEWFMTDHHDRFPDSIGYRTYWVYPESEYVCFQLELVSDPLDDSYDDAQFAADARRLYSTNLAELLRASVVAPYTPGRRQKIKEQVSIEIDDVRWSERTDPLRKLHWLAAGMYLLTRLHNFLESPDDHVNSLLQALDDNIVTHARALQNYDLLSNYRLLLDGYFFGVQAQLDWETLRRFASSRMHTAILCAEYDNDRCSYLVHGEAEIRSEEARLLRREDFGLLRSLGIDSRFLDLLLSDTQPHLDPQRLDRLDFIRESLEPFLDVEAVRHFLGAAMADQDTAVGSVAIPLCHPRKTITPGCVYLECRTAHRFRTACSDRYPTKFRDVEGPDGSIEVISFGHLRTMARDLSSIMDIAITIGAEFARIIEAGDHGVREKDFDRLTRHFEPRLAYLLRSYRRPPWTEDAACR